MSQQVDQYQEQIIQVEQESAKKADCTHEALDSMKMEIKDLQKQLEQQHTSQSVNQ